MALDLEIRKPYNNALPSNSPVYLYFYIKRIEQYRDQVRYSYSMAERNDSGQTSLSTTTKYPFKLTINGKIYAQGSHDLNFADGYKYRTIAEGITDWYTSNDQGDSSVFIEMEHKASGSPFGEAVISGGFAADRLYYTPSVPLGLTFISQTSTSVTFTVTPPGDDGNTSILYHEYQVAAGSDVNFDNVLESRINYGTTQTFSGLTPGAQYRFRFRSTNSIGWSIWSNTYLRTSDPVTAPPAMITPTLSGTAVDVTVGAIENLPNPSGYRIERTDPQGVVTVIDTTYAPYRVTGLVPGSRYGWRVAGKSSSSTTPYSAIQYVIQPNPNTKPGDYFDGSTSSSDATTYEWTGTAGKSVSRATQKAAVGWATFHSGGGSSIVTRASGGLFSTYCALVTVKTDTNTPGMSAGVDGGSAYRVQVGEAAPYFGSIYVLLSRAQRMALQVTWYNAAGAVISSSTGTASVVAASLWTRLQATLTSPTGAVSATVRAIDVSGTGYSRWLAGERFLMDGAMMTLGEQLDYFDGSFKDDATYDYVWEGTAHASISTRKVVTGLPIDLLADPDLPAVPLAPRPPAVPDVALESPDNWRRYWLKIPKDSISSWLKVMLTLTLRTGAESAHQARIRVFENPLDLDPGGVDVHVWASEQIVSFIPARTELVLDSVSRRAFARVNGAAAVAADKLVYGTGGEPARWPELSCGQGYLVAIDVPLDSPEGNLSVSLALTRRW